MVVAKPTVRRRTAVWLAILPAIGAIAVASTIVHATSESTASRAMNGAPGLVASPAPSPRLAARTAAGTSPPNILVIVLDDIGIDQMGFAPFGWNSSDLTPEMPVLEAIAQAGVSFTNFWTAPECSPTRAGMLTGRYGFRTGVLTAIVDPMLPVNQLNPAEVTLPKLLGPAGYRTAMIGKYHLGGSPDNTPPEFGYEAPATAVGLDFYDGYWALPPSIDTTIGGQVPNDTYNCGGLGGLGALGAACFLAPDGTHFCVEGIAPFEAMAMGGTPLLNADGTLSQSCEASGCDAIDFTAPNAYYAWPRVTTQADGSYEVSTKPQREYLTSFISHRTTEWVKGFGGSEPWLAFVTHSSAHTPIQPPPPSLSTPDPREPNCDLDDPDQAFRIQFKRMCESTDRSVGEMLVELGLATTDGKTVTLIDPKITNTMIVVFGDNGSLGNTVLPPFDPLLAKQSVYQTGVWTACIVAGPMVHQSNRQVDAMVNVVDLFGLIADAAGVDWQASIPSDRVIDSRPMMPYLTEPSTRPIRQFDYAVYGQGTFAPGQVGPCILGGQVVDGLITSPGLCEDNGGCWAGGADRAPYRVTNYCDLLDMGTFECHGTIYCVSAENPFCDSNLPSCGDNCLKPPNLGQWAIRSGQWKLIALTYPTCLAPNDCELQFYHLAVPQPPDEPGVDFPDGPARIDLDNMGPEEQAMFDQLRTELYATLSSEWYCPGDGNKDFRVDQADLAGLLESWGGPGFWDIDENGMTDAVDLGLLLGDWNPNCVGQLNPTGQNIPGCLQPA